MQACAFALRRRRVYERVMEERAPPSSSEVINAFLAPFWRVRAMLAPFGVDQGQQDQYAQRILRSWPAQVIAVSSLTMAALRYAVPRKGDGACARKSSRGALAACRSVTTPIIISSIAAAAAIRASGAAV